MTSKKENERSLRDAASKGNISTVNELIGRGTNLNAADDVRLSFVFNLTYFLKDTLHYYCMHSYVGLVNIVEWVLK